MDELPPESVRKWCLAAPAILTTINHASHEHLGGGPLGTAASTNAAAILKNSWGVEDREQLASLVQWLQGSGHDAEYKALVARLPSASPAEIAGDRKLAFVKERGKAIGDKGLVAWDHCRAISLVGWGVAAGILPEREAWRWILPSARRLQMTYASWQDLGEGYTLGCAFWSAAHEQECRDAMAKLASDPKSPWKLVPYKTDLFADDTPSGVSVFLWPRVISCVISAFAGVIAVTGACAVGGYVIWTIQQDGAFDGVVAAGTPRAEAEEEGAWSGATTLTCGGNDKITVKGVTAVLPDVAVLAQGNCAVTLDGVDLTAAVALRTEGNAKVTVKGGRLHGSDKAVDALGNSKVTLEGTELVGAVSHATNAKVIGP